MARLARGKLICCDHRDCAEDFDLRTGSLDDAHATGWQTITLHGRILRDNCPAHTSSDYVECQCAACVVKFTASISATQTTSSAMTNYRGLLGSSAVSGPRSPVTIIGSAAVQAALTHTSPS